MRRRRCTYPSSPPRPRPRRGTWAPFSLFGMNYKSANSCEVICGKRLSGRTRCRLYQWLFCCEATASNDGERCYQDFCDDEEKCTTCLSGQSTPEMRPFKRPNTDIINSHCIFFSSGDYVLVSQMKNISSHHIHWPKSGGLVDI